MKLTFLGEKNLLLLMSETLPSPTVDFVAGANSSGSNLGIRRATKEVRTLTDLHIDFYDPIVDSNG